MNPKTMMTLYKCNALAVAEKIYKGKVSRRRLAKILKMCRKHSSGDLDPLHGTYRVTLRQLMDESP